MKITLNWLEEKDACQPGVGWFKSQKETDGIRVVNALMDDDKFQWANWTVVRLMEKPQQVQYAIFAAEKVIGIYEKKYPEDKRPRNAIDAAKEYLKNPSNESMAKARAAAAYAAAAYAADAADAAYAAADAAYAADAAAYAAYAAYAAAYAASAAARKKLYRMIIEYGISLLKEPVEVSK